MRLACPNCHTLIPVVDIDGIEVDCPCGSILVHRFDLAGGRLVDATYYSFEVSARSVTIDICEVP